jgi:hypothetical protein
VGVGKVKTGLGILGILEHFLGETLALSARNTSSPSKGKLN